MGLYDRLEDEKIGRAAKMGAMANKRGEELADQKLAEAEALAQQQMMQQMAAQQPMGGMPMGGGVPMGQQGGLGFSNMDPIQGQADAHEQAMNQAAMEVVTALQQADAQGATPEQIEMMIRKTPPELQGRVLQILQADMEQNASMGQQPGVPPQGMPTQGAPAQQQQPDPRTMHLQGNPITEYARQLAMEQDKQQQPLPPQQQMY